MTEGVQDPRCSPCLVYLIALPFVFVAGAGFIAFFIATALRLGREVFRARGDAVPHAAEAKADARSRMPRWGSPRDW